MQTPLPGLTFDPFQDPLFECISRDPVVTETLYNMTGSKAQNIHLGTLSVVRNVYRLPGRIGEGVANIITETMTNDASSFLRSHSDAMQLDPA